MARLEEKIAEIKDPELRGTIAEEVKALKAQKQFGLVFEQHQPEVVRVYRVPVKAGVTVAKKAGSLTETWRVVRVRDDMAELVKDTDDSRESAPVDSLTVVRRMGQAIHPALVPVDQVQNGDPSQPHHILIEADNYHALQLLGYLYAGKVDCIYIDPPYNTGARDWKYNNDYVDSADQWRHSKWLTFMEKRLKLAKRLLNHNGVLAIAIDNNELAHLVCLIETGGDFDNYDITIVTVAHNPRGNITANFAKINEYVIYLTPKSRQILARTIVDSEKPRKLRRWGHFSLRTERRSMFYPIYVQGGVVVRIGEQPTDDFHPASRNVDVGEGITEVWPIDQNGVERRWNYAYSEINSHIERIVALPKDGGIDLFLASELSPPKTVWVAPELDAGGVYGSSFVESVVGTKFPYPKSLYGILRAIEPIILRKPNSLIVDFFAGSGTTLNAVNLLNANDGGHRQCILVTNNEVSEDEASNMTAQGLQPGDEAWDAVGICRSVTWPRNKFTILGKRDDGTALNGEYFTGRTVSKEKPRTIRQLGFAEGRTLSLAQRKQLAALVPSLPQSKLQADTPWFLDDDLPVSVLWDVQQAAAWLEKLTEAEHLTDILVVTTENRLFNALALQVKETLGPLTVEEDEKRPMAAGFATNLAYFKLDFLEPTEVAMGRQFAAILPMLWMMAGAKGSRPEAPDAHAHWLLPEGCPFVVLMREGRFREFLAKIEGRADLTHVFLVTNSDSAYHDMRGDLPEHIEVVQLYKNYLDNFKINTQRR